MHFPLKSVPILRLIAILCFACAFARADEFVTIDFPIGPEKLVSPGLSVSPRQVERPDGVGYTEVWLRPVHKTDQVFLTFIFEEDGDKSLAVFWSGDVSGRQTTICESLAQGVTGLNSRTIALPGVISSEAGRLYIMGRQTLLKRLRIDWCEPTQTFVAGDQERAAFISSGRVKLDRELTGQGVMTPPDAWFGKVLDASLQDGVAPLSENTEFMVPIKGVVAQARLRAKFLDLPLGKSVRIWVNGRVAGRIQPESPSLTDPGYVRRDHHTIYAGWRQGALYIEPELLKQGDNSILFESAGKGVYVSGTALELESEAPAAAPDENSDLNDLNPELSKGENPSASPSPTPSPRVAPSPSPTPASSPDPQPSPTSSPSPSISPTPLSF